MCGQLDLKAILGFAKEMKILYTFMILRVKNSISKIDPKRNKNHASIL
jgi:hypothetical protein